MGAAAKPVVAVVASRAMVGICPAAEGQRETHVVHLPGAPSTPPERLRTLHSFILHGCDVFKARRGDVPVPASPFLPAPLWGMTRRTAQVGSVSGGSVPARPAPRPHSPALLVVPGGAAAVPALTVPAAAPLLSAAALLSATGWRSTPTSPPVSLSLSLCLTFPTIIIQPLNLTPNSPDP